MLGGVASNNGFAVVVLKEWDDRKADVGALKNIAQQ